MAGGKILGTVGNFGVVMHIAPVVRVLGCTPGTAPQVAAVLNLDHDVVVSAVHGAQLTLTGVPLKAGVAEVTVEVSPATALAVGDALTRRCAAV